MRVSTDTAVLPALCYGRLGIVTEPPPHAGAAPPVFLAGGRFNSMAVYSGQLLFLLPPCNCNSEGLRWIATVFFWHGGCKRRGRRPPIG